ncbi:MAG: helix-turn-helix domain-containing protein [Acidobacteriota bacterium]
MPKRAAVSPTSSKKEKNARQGQREPQQQRSRVTRDKILSAAERLFAHKGYEEVTSHEIAATAGVAIGSFYAYFADKEQLLLHLLEERLDEEYQDIFADLQPQDLFEPDPRPALRRAIENHFASKARHRWITRVLQSMAHKNARIAAIDQRLFERSQAQLRTLLTLANKAGLTYHFDIPVVSMLVVLMVDHIGIDCAESPLRKQRSAVIDALVDMIYRSLFQQSSLAIQQSRPGLTHR